MPKSQQSGIHGRTTAWKGSKAVISLSVCINALCEDSASTCITILIMEMGMQQSAWPAQMQLEKWSSDHRAPAEKSPLSGPDVAAAARQCLQARLGYLELRTLKHCGHVGRPESNPRGGL